MLCFVSQITGYHANIYVSIQSFLQHHNFVLINPCSRCFRLWVFVIVSYLICKEDKHAFFPLAFWRDPACTFRVFLAFWHSQKAMALCPDFANSPTNSSWQEVLSSIKASGLIGLIAGNFLSPTSLFKGTSTNLEAQSLLRACKCQQPLGSGEANNLSLAGEWRRAMFRLQIPRISFICVKMIRYFAWVLILYIIAMTNYHKLSSSKRHKFIITQYLSVKTLRGRN